MNYKNDTSHITTSLGDQGLGQQPWWVEQWMELINSYRFKKRLERAWSYARAGNVTSIRFEGRRIHARVQGTESQPYKVKLWLDVLDEDDWQYVLEALTGKASWSAQLLAGVMPMDIENAFAISGRRLFPFKLEDVRSECSCPDKANPCKHISAIYYLMGDRFKEDPFVLFQLRGRSKEQLLSDLTKKRLLLTESQIDIKQNEIKEESENILKRSSAIKDAKMWWQYNENLHSDLVVITNALLGENALNLAGEIGLAEDPLFPGSKSIFMENLYKYSEIFAEKAMLKAMSGSK